MLELRAELVSRAAFSPYGDLIETDNASVDSINSGTSIRYKDLSRIQLTEPTAQASVHIYRAVACNGIVEVQHLECHPLSSQLFMPLERQPFIAVVALAGKFPAPTDVRAFLIDAGRGINLAQGVWHHPLLSMSGGDYLVVERAEPAQNLKESILSEPLRLITQ